MRALTVGLLCFALVACASPTVTVSPTPAVTPSPTPTATLGPSPTPTTFTRLVCGLLPQAACGQVAAMVERQFRFAAHATALVMDYICPPGDFCVAGFRAIVSVVIPRDPTVDYAYWPPSYAVSGTSGPETLQPWVDPLPASLTTLLRSVGFSG